MRRGGCGSEGAREWSSLQPSARSGPGAGWRQRRDGGQAGEEATRRAPRTPHSRRSCGLRGDGRGPAPSRRLPSPRAHKRPGEHARPSHSRGLGASPRPGTPRGEHGAPLKTPHPRFCRRSLWTVCPQKHGAPDSPVGNGEDRSPLSYSKPEQGVQKEFKKSKK